MLDFIFLKTMGGSPSGSLDSAVLRLFSTRSTLDSEKLTESILMLSGTALGKIEAVSSSTHGAREGSYGLVTLCKVS